MLLIEFFNQPEGDSYADHQATKKVSEAKRISKKDDPCWKGYHMVGTKDKGDKAVPNCVPVAEDNHLSDVVNAKQLISAAKNNPSKAYEYRNFINHLRKKYGTQYSIDVHQQASKLTKAN